MHWNGKLHNFFPASHTIESNFQHKILSQMSSRNITLYSTFAVAYIPHIASSTMFPLISFFFSLLSLIHSADSFASHWWRWWCLTTIDNLYIIHTYMHYLSLFPIPFWKIGLGKTYYELLTFLHIAQLCYENQSTWLNVKWMKRYESAVI